jgi:hypothetical protein
MPKDHPPKLPDDYIQREFETYRKAFEAGNEWGLADAMTLCKEYPTVPLPSWALNALQERHADAYHGAYKRSAKWKRQYQQDMIDFGRADIVKDCIEHGTPWKVVYEIASKMLEGCPDAGNPDAIEKSYKRFTRRMKSDPWRYYIPRSIRQKDSGKRATKEYLEWFMKTFPDGQYK